MTKHLRLLAALLLLPLAACGFHPLYGTSSYDPAILDELASIRVDTIPDRQGQMIHNALLTNLAPRGESDHPRYRLSVRPTVTEVQQALATDYTATRDVLMYNVQYRLYEGQNTIAAGTMSYTFSYDFLEEHYANLSAKEDVQRRAAITIGAEIRNRLAAYFAKAAEMKAAAGKQ